MTVTKNLFKKFPPLKNPSYFQKIPKSYKTLAKSHHKSSSKYRFRPHPDVDFNLQTENDLKLDHPVIKKLESCVNIPQFNQIQTQLIIRGLFQHSFTSSRVIKKLCSFPNELGFALSVFEKLEKPDAFMCNVFIRRCFEKGEFEKGLDFYYDYFVFGFFWVNHYTFPLVIRICVEIGSGFEGEKAHCRVLKCGFGLDLFVRNSLIRMYSVFSKVWSAQKVFDESPELDLVTWNIMLDGYVKNGELRLARELFDEMRVRDGVTWNSMIAGYVGVKDVESAIELFGTMPSRDIISWNCLIDGCARIGDSVAARGCFDRMPTRNVVSWNTMLALYVRCKDYDECLRLFERMIKERNVLPNEATLVSVLTACGYLRRLDQGKWVHSYIKSNQRIKPDVLLSTALLTMYTKCGDMDLARRVFDSMPRKSVVSWNSMITGYGSHGLVDNAFEIFSEMERSGQVPNDATFVCVLAACVRSCRVLEGWWYFHVMDKVYKNKPKVQHYGCMVDLLEKSGLVKTNEIIVNNNPTRRKSASWKAVLSACHVRSNLELGEVVGKWLIEKQPENMGPYLLLSNIYAVDGRWEYVEEVRRVMQFRGVHKNAPADWLKDDAFHRNSVISSMLIRLGSRLKTS